MGLHEIVTSRGGKPVQVLRIRQNSQEDASKRADAQAGEIGVPMGNSDVYWRGVRTPVLCGCLLCMSFCRKCQVQVTRYVGG